MFKMLFLLCATHQPICMGTENRPAAYYYTEAECKVALDAEIASLKIKWEAAMPHDPMVIKSAVCKAYDGRYQSV